MFIIFIVAILVLVAGTWLVVSEYRKLQRSRARRIVRDKNRILRKHALKAAVASEDAFLRQIAFQSAGCDSFASLADYALRIITMIGLVCLSLIFGVLSVWLGSRMWGIPGLEVLGFAILLAWISIDDISDFQRQLVELASYYEMQMEERSSNFGDRENDV